MDWRCGSNSRVPSLQTQIPEFKTQSRNNNKKRKLMLYSHGVCHQNVGVVKTKSKSKWERKRLRLLSLAM
jgi:hypothetical protein